MDWLRNGLLSAAGVLAALAVTEIGLRVAGVSYPSFYQFDYFLGGSLRPGAEGWYRREGESHVRINSDGLRDAEHEKAKPPDTFRIAVLGDSYVEAKQVPLEQTFLKVTERELARCEALGGRRAEVLNFGVSGYGTAQELIMLRRRVWQYSPDAVVLAITTGNDIRNNSRELEPEKRRPFFKLEEGRLVEDDSFRDDAYFKLSRTRLWSALHWLADHCRIVQVGYLAISVARARWEERTLEAAGHRSNGTDPDLDAMVYQPPRDPRWQRAWAVTEALLARLDKEVSDKEALFLAVTLSNPGQVMPDRRADMAFAKALGVPNLFYPDERIQRLGERAGFAVLSLAEPLQAYALEHHVYMHGFPNTVMGGGHWNAEGHRVAGEMLARRLCGMIVPRVREAAQ